MDPSKLRAAISVGFAKTAREWTESQRATHTKKRWDSIAGSLESSGVMVGGNKRVLVPRSKLTEKDLTKTLGFVPVTVAVPEAGQTQIRSFRHPTMNHHVHQHGDHWNIHEDKHPSTSMLMYRLRQQKRKAKERARTGVSGVHRAAQHGVKKAPTYRDVAKATVSGMPHLIGEGVPGMYYYLKGRVTRAPGMLQKVAPRLDKKFVRRVKRMRPSSTYQESEG